MPNGFDKPLPIQFDHPLPEEDSLIIGVNAVAQAAEHIAGVRGFNRKSGPGVAGGSKDGDGVVGSGGSNGVHGQTSASVHSGVWGENTDTGFGVAGTSSGGEGVLGIGGTNGVHGQSGADGHSGVWGENTGGGVGVAGTSVNGFGVFGKARVAGRFEGDVEVTGDIRLLNAGDCAEEFEIAEPDDIEPGTVMVIHESGALLKSRQAYDTRVAGIVSGAGGYRPGIVLNARRTDRSKVAIALVGRVFCKADASFGPIAVGDLLTTSPTVGCSMKAADPLKAFGAIVGKALGRLDEGQSLIPVLVALQ